MNYFQFIMILCSLLLGGILFAKYEKMRRDPSSTWTYHLYQWSSIILGMVTFYYAGRIHAEDTVFADVFVTASIFVAPGIGYILGRKIFVR